MKIHITKIKCSVIEPKVTVYTSCGSVSSILRFGAEFISYPTGTHNTQFLRPIGQEVNKTSYFRKKELMKAKEVEKELINMFL